MITKRAQFLINIVVGCIVLGVAANWMFTRNDEIEKQPRPLSTSERQDKIASLFQPALFKALTNDVAGLNKIIKFSLPDVDAPQAEWKGDATVEFVNTIGGVERTTRYYTFHKVESSGQISVLCFEDFPRTLAASSAR